MEERNSSLETMKATAYQNAGEYKVVVVERVNGQNKHRFYTAESAVDAYWLAEQFERTGEEDGK